MKKIFIIASLMFVLPFVTSAASFVITPSSGSYTNGDTVTLHISVDPAGSAIYAAMLNANFSPSTFEVVSFTLNDSMLAVKQAGDSVDNVNGTLVKTGGYTGGVSSVTPFGTLVLKAKGNGAATFTANSSSKLLDSNNTNKQNGSQTASFIVVNKTPVVTPVVAPKVEVPKKTVANAVAPKQEQTNATTSGSKLSDEKAVSTQVAAVAASSSSSNIYWILALIICSAVFFLFGIAVGRRTK
jgi:hypothetical protein